MSRTKNVEGKSQFMIILWPHVEMCWNFYKDVKLWGLLLQKQYAVVIPLLYEHV